MLKLYIAGNLGAATSEAILIDPLKVTAGLTTGIVEIFDKHCDVMGNILNNSLEFTFSKENKTETRTFFFRTASFWVGNKNIINFNLLTPNSTNTTERKNDTTVLVYANNMMELKFDANEELIIKDIERVKKELTIELEIEKPDTKQKAQKKNIRRRISLF
jgi:hypothetical protein